MHVGAEADLSATMTVTPENPSPDDGVTITITASNAGPDEAEKTEVDVTLPKIDGKGLTYRPPHATGTYADGVWSIGELAVTDDDNTETSDDSPTLTITATVDENTHGQELTVDATISATESVTITETKLDENDQPVVDGNGNTVKEAVTRPVPVPDPNPTNNTPMGTITVANKSNVNPMFVVTRSVPEHSPVNTLVGGPIAVMDPDDDTLTFTLTGEGAEKFTATSVEGAAQIKVAGHAHLKYSTKSSYDLVLAVKDRKDVSGNADEATDHTIALKIDIIGVTIGHSPEHPRINTDVTWTAHLHNLPANSGDVRYTWKERSQLSGSTSWSSWTTLPHTGSSFEESTGSSSGTKQMSVEATIGPQGSSYTVGPTVKELSWQQ